MNEKSESKNKLYCKLCDKNYKSMSSLCNHNKKFHSKIVSITQSNGINQKNDVIIESPLPENNKNQILICKYCTKNFSHRNNRWRHEQKCKNIYDETKSKEKEKEIELEKIKLEQINAEKEKINAEKEKINAEKEKINAQKELIKLKFKNSDDQNKITSLESQVNNSSLPINSQLINTIIEKDKEIEKLKNNNLTSQNDIVVVNKEISQINTLTLNDVVIVSRSEDNYINATQLCQAGNKKFNDWYRLDSTKQLTDALNCDTGIPVSQLVDVKKGNSSEFNQGSWIHPDLAIQLAQWISPLFALQVSKWIRSLFTDGYVNINLKNEIKDKDKKIKLLENTYLKKHKRTQYPTENVVYLLTTEEHKKNRIYIVGRAKKLTGRLSGYNKTLEHDVVYYKSCDSLTNLIKTEDIILFKLEKYRCQANRDRFVLPLEKDISFFTDIYDEVLSFINI
jgi:hypothetical protein